MVSDVCDTSEHGYEFEDHHHHHPLPHVYHHLSNQLQSLLDDLLAIVLLLDNKP